MRGQVTLHSNTGLAVPGKLSAVGLELPVGLSFDQWSVVVDQLRLVTRASMWWWGDALNYGEQKWGEKYSQALDESDYDYQTLANAKYIAERFQFSRRRENLSFSHHSEVADLTPEKADALLDEAFRECWTRDELRRAARRARLPDAAPTALPDGYFRVFYADPPWRYGDKLVEGYGSAEHHYQTMSIDELCQLEVIDHVPADAVLFMWVTSPIIPECFPVIKAWGFEYKSSFVWDKVKHNMGHYNSVRHELLFVCTRGSCVPDVPSLVDSVVEVERGAHSEKPERFREIIDTLYPTGRRVELFARKDPPAPWIRWGNQVLREAA